MGRPTRRIKSSRAGSGRALDRHLTGRWEPALRLLMTGEASPQSDELYPRRDGS